MIAALAITFLCAFAAGWAACNHLKDRRAERAEARLREANAQIADREARIRREVAWGATVSAELAILKSRTQ
jgi:hypothetical protein